MTSEVSNTGTHDLILVVDDQVQLRHLLKRMLERRGCEVITASDGVEAIERFTELKDRIGLVLMDIQMPRMTGIEAARRIRALSQRPRLVLMSAQVTGVSEQYKASIGLYAFLPKPFSRATLLEMIPETCVKGEPQTFWIQ